MHKNLYKHRFIEVFEKASIHSTKNYLQQLSKNFRITAKQPTREVINQMWILKNSKVLLEHLQSPIFNHITREKEEI